MSQSAARPAAAPAIIPLHGRWSRAVGGREIDSVAVPGTYPPVGACTLARTVEVGAVDPGSRYFLRTEGVLAWARFAIDGQEIGTAGPWSRHRFEIPRERVRARMHVSAEITDILAPFGPTPGRRFDAGLFRPIAIERRPRTYIKDWHLAYRLAAPWTEAACTVALELDGPDRPEIACTLTERQTGRVVASARGRAGEPLAFALAHPRLWSPAMPVLYDLRVSAGDDEAAEAVGFRLLESKGRDLWLNGERLLLKGVCRHEFMSGFGYSPPEAEVRRELARIRHAGFNHIRLVHSPQAPWVPRIAAEVGILVSEEPGTCFHDLGDPRVADPAIDALTAMVRRDRNLPSILAWYIYNECNPHTGYAVRAAEACRALDPACLLAMADCSGRIDDIKAMVQAANLSFYGINCYTYWANDYQKWMDTYTDRPLVFTEWGGCMAQGNRRVMDWLARTFAEATRVDAGRRVSGASYWAWADYEEYSRAEFAAIDGWTVEGLIDAQGQPKPDLALLSQWCFDVDHPAPAREAVPEILLRMPRRPGRFAAIDLGAVEGDQTAAEAALATLRNPGHASNWASALAVPLPAWPSLESVEIAGVPFAGRGGRGSLRPLLLGKGRAEAVIPIGRRASGVSILGHVAFGAAYPANDIHSVHHKDAETVRPCGAPAASYTFVFADGEETIALLHGVHVLRGNDICRWWRTLPQAPETAAAIRATTHPSYEILRLDLWEKSWGRPRELREIRWRSQDPESVLALAALTVHEA